MELLLLIVLILVTIGIILFISLGNHKTPNFQKAEIRTTRGGKNFDYEIILQDGFYHIRIKRYTVLGFDYKYLSQSFINFYSDSYIKINTDGFLHLKDTPAVTFKTVNYDSIKALLSQLIQDVGYTFKNAKEGVVFSTENHSSERPDLTDVADVELDNIGRVKN